MQLQDIFQRLGYPKHSEVIYEMLRKQKEAYLVTDISKTTKLPRMTVYRCLKALLPGNLVEESKIGKRSYYIAGSPHALAQAMKLTESENEETLKKFMREREKDVPQSVRFLRGPAGIRAAFDDVITHCKKDETFFRYTSEKDLVKVNSYLARDYRKRRDKKRLERKVISNQDSGSQKRSRLERFIKFVPAEADQFEQNIIQLIYGSRVSIIDLNTEEVMIIENKQLADFQRVIFNLLYKRL